MLVWSQDLLRWWCSLSHLRESIWESTASLVHHHQDEVLFETKRDLISSHASKRAIRWLKWTLRWQSENETGAVSRSLSLENSFSRHEDLSSRWSRRELCLLHWVTFPEKSECLSYLSFPASISPPFSSDLSWRLWWWWSNEKVSQVKRHQKKRVEHTKTNLCVRNW